MLTLFVVGPCYWHGHAEVREDEGGVLRIAVSNHQGIGVPTVLIPAETSDERFQARVGSVGCHPIAVT